MSKIKSKTILFITGAYVSHACWDKWRLYFEGHGYNTIAPPWPCKDADAVTLRKRHPYKALAAVSMYDIIDHYNAIIRKLPERPILIGHSFGGLFAQVLLNRGVAAAAVAIHAVPPQGVIPYELNFLKSNAATLGFFTSINKTFLMSFSKWRFAFTNGMPRQIQESSYEEMVIPESKKAARGGLTKAAYVDFKKEHEPLLLLAGTQDQCIPAHLCKRVYERYKSKNSITDFVLKDRNHFVLGQPTWKEDAGYILNWLNQH
ncbi:alpha/beta hydrolase [Chitinophaga sp. CF418]|uniref:alpha/beta hydrolase n=1 Tax=Chitinophaga sp. CF418 TaxID=1855287 RepID=UPI000916BF6F|nr:alpha/beta hydrolase [Chitinophaga sp. CF418]SHL96663.1 Pimeloyl-ACP methyl ester carboxylesterase [Chitinophaga sp. CF418]